MEIDRIYAIGLLGLLAALFVGHQGLRAVRFGHRQCKILCKYAHAHLALPKIFQGRLFLNPTRLEAFFHITHWVAVVVFDTFRVNSLHTAQTRTAQLAVIHLVPLMVSFQLSCTADSLGLSLKTFLKLHGSLGLMATLHGIAHAGMHLWTRHGSAHQGPIGILVCSPRGPHPKAQADTKLVHDGADGIDADADGQAIRL